MSTSKSTSFSLPVEIGNQLRALAKHKGKTATAAITEWVLSESRALGLTIDNAPISLVCVHGEDPSLVADLFGEWRLPLSLVEAKSFAESLHTVIAKGGVHKPGAGCFDLDISPMMTFARRGAGVSIEGEAYLLDAPEDRVAFRKTMSVETAEVIVRELREAVAESV